MVNLKHETSRKLKQIKLQGLLEHAIRLDPQVKNKQIGIVTDATGGRHATRGYAVKYCGHQRNYLVNNKRTHKRCCGGLFCNERLCVICSKIKAYRARIKLATMLSYLNKHYQYKNGNPRYMIIFLTLSVPNSKNNFKDFRRVHRLLSHNFSKMLRYKRFDGFTKRNDRKHHGLALGAVGKIEQTYNAHLDSWNLHLHSYILVHRSYFTSKYYCPFKEWRYNWERACGWNPLNHNGKHLQVCVEKPFYKDFQGRRHSVDQRSTSEELRKARHSAVCELTAYETKAVDFQKILRTKSGLTKGRKKQLQQRTFDTAYFGLKHQRTYNFLGMFKYLNQMYRSGKLDAYKPQDSNIYEYEWNTEYSRSAKEYKTTKFRKLMPIELNYYRCMGLKTALTLQERSHLDCVRAMAEKHLEHRHWAKYLHSIGKSKMTRLVYNMAPLSLKVTPRVSVSDTEKYAHKIGVNAIYSNSELQMLGMSMFG